MNVTDASKPGVLDLGSMTLFLLGNNAYIASVASDHRDWEPMFRQAFATLMPGARLLIVYRRTSDTPSYTALAESADLRQMVEEIVVEALKKVMNS